MAVAFIIIALSCLAWKHKVTKTVDNTSGILPSDKRLDNWNWNEIKKKVIGLK